jgi:hypothetical protein
MYKNSVKCKKSNNLPDEDLKLYGKHLNDVYKLRKLKQTLPPELLLSIINETTNPS